MYSRYEGEYRQRLLQESRRARESRELNMTHRLTRTMRGKRKRKKREDEEEFRQRKPRKCMAKLAGLYKNQKLGQGKPIIWTGLGVGTGEKS